MIFTPEYRKKGLVRRQIQRLHQIVEDRGYDISLLWGIPFYYRQFGYSYCVEGLATQSLPAWRVEEAPAAAPCRLRAAGLGDLPLLARMYPRCVAGLDVHLQRGEAHWRYLLESAKFPIFVVEAARTAAHWATRSWSGTSGRCTSSKAASRTRRRRWPCFSC
jgi:predicted acetyltransferase